MFYNFLGLRNDEPVLWIVGDLVAAIKKRLPYFIAGLVAGLIIGYAWRMAQTGGHF